MQKGFDLASFAVVNRIERVRPEQLFNLVGAQAVSHGSVTTDPSVAPSFDVQRSLFEAESSSRCPAHASTDRRFRGSALRRCPSASATLWNRDQGLTCGGFEQPPGFGRPRLLTSPRNANADLVPVRVIAHPTSSQPSSQRTSGRRTWIPARTQHDGPAHPPLRDGMRDGCRSGRHHAVAAEAARAHDLRLRRHDLERATGIEPAFSAWESVHGTRPRALMDNHGRSASESSAVRRLETAPNVGGCAIFPR